MLLCQAIPHRGGDRLFSTELASGKAELRAILQANLSFLLEHIDTHHPRWSQLCLDSLSLFGETLLDGTIVIVLIA